jgi:prevent-host-death family protein
VIKVNIHEVKTHFSEYLEKVAAGETVIVCKRNVPVAEIRPLKAGQEKKRTLGFYKGGVHIPDEFWDPLPQELQDYFDGKK